jgi:beta-glucosidase
MGFAKSLKTLAVTTAIGLALAGAAIAAAPADQPWMDPQLTPDARADLVLHQMTPDEKLVLVFGYFATDAPWKQYTRPAGSMADAAGFVPGIERLGIPAQSQTDAGVGVATQRSATPRLRTSLPSGLATAATWDPDMAFAGGAMIGNEARLSGFNVMLAGGVNLLREPRNGRNFEYGGEDPYLAGTIVGNEIKGIQSNNVISTVKHYALNDQATGQSDLDARIDDAAARSSDLLAFQFAIETGHPGAVMCSYNIVNAKHSCENDWLLGTVLKGDWRYPGFVMSDWGATHSAAPSANAGLDQDSGYPFDDKPWFKDELKAAIASGQVPQSRVDDMARRILRSMFAVGLFDAPLSGDQSAKIDYAAHQKAAQADEEEAIVLLKNTLDEKAGDLLPLAKTARTIAVIGGHADVGVLSGGGSSQVYPHGAPDNGLIIPNEGPDAFPGPMIFDPSSPVKELQSRTHATVTYADGTDVNAAAALAAQSDIVIVFATQWTAEGMDVPDLNLPKGQDALISAVAKANPKTIVVLETGGPVVMPWLKDVGAVVEAWFPGAGGGTAIARVLTGEVDPSGHLPATFPASLDQLPRPILDGNNHSHAIFPVDYNIEGAAVGYKWFDKKNLKPLFPFGFGLSYTRFSFEGLEAHPAGKTLSVSFTLNNNGKVDGKAVPQVYVSPPANVHWEAPKRLGAFTKVATSGHSSQIFNLTVDPRLLGVYDATSKTWKIAGGEYTVSIGDSSAYPAQTIQVHLSAQTVDVNGK